MAVKDWDTTAANNDDADGTINWLEGMAPSAVNDSARAMMAAIASWYLLIDGGTVSGGTVGGTAAAITLTNSPTVDAIAAGQRYAFKFTSATTGATTLKVDGATAGNLLWRGAALVADDFAADDWCLCICAGTDFHLLIPPRISGANDLASLTTDTTIGATGDLIPFLDASDSNAPNKGTVASLFANAINNATEETSVAADADFFVGYDANASAYRKFKSRYLKPAEVIAIPVGGQTAAITTGTGKFTFRMPFAMTLTDVRASVKTAPTGATIIIDINEGGTTILSTKLSIDATEKTSTTAASAAVISDASLADDAEMTIDFDQVGSTVAGAGVVVYLIGYRT